VKASAGKRGGDASTELGEECFDRGDDLAGDVFWGEQYLDTDRSAVRVEVHRDGVAAHFDLARRGIIAQ